MAGFAGGENPAEGSGDTKYPRQPYTKGATMSRKQENHLEVMSIGGFNWSTNDTLKILWTKYGDLLDKFEESLRLYIREHASETTLETEQYTVTQHNMEVEVESVVEGTMGNPAHYLLIDWHFTARQYMMLNMEEHEGNLCMILDDVIKDEGVQWMACHGVSAHMLYNIIWLEEGTTKCRAFVELYWEDSKWA